MLNAHNQVWDAPNVYVTDGAAMTSAACQNPSLTYMALTARAVDHAVGELKKQNIYLLIPTRMNRRDALARVAVLMGGTVIGAEFFLTGCSSPAGTSSKAGETAAKFTLSPTQLSMLDEVGETILPATKTPGAKAAKIGNLCS